jgi:S-adenosylmethionine hydrolase
MKQPIITLLTDFGTKDYYVASMKGVILSINPRCSLVDITHQVSPHDIEAGAFILANAYSSFPKGTIHLSVVDPGVGSPRKPILFVTPDYFFVGPDNGLFPFALRKEKVTRAVVLTNPKFFLSRVSSTFQGRDLFAPVAAHLSLGVRPEAFGSIIKSWEELNFRKPETKGGELVGEVLHVDAFGNLVTNIGEGELFNFTQGQPFVFKAGKQKIHGLSRGYWEGQGGKPIVLLGSAGFLEISVREGSAQKFLNIGRGDRISVQKLRE